MKRLSIVAARKELGRLADEVRRTGQPIVLTRRGRPIARIAPQPIERGREDTDVIARLRGSLEMEGSFSDLRAAVRDLRREGARSLRGRGGGKSGRR
jgi:prevent-host-death family protein